jgi:tetratricopeptide (TPR) repeat protein/Tol biopolymer transport system component
MASSPDGHWLASVGYDQAIKIWNLATRAEAFCFRGVSDRVTNLAWSKNGQFLAFVTLAGGIQIWDARKGKDKVFLSGPREPAEKPVALAWRPDGRQIASLVTPSGAESQVWIWDVETAKPIIKKKAGTKRLADYLAWSPDGKYLAMGPRFEQTLPIWNTETWQIERLLNGHLGMLNLSWSPVGQKLAFSASAGVRHDVTIQRWDGSGNPMASQLRGHTGPVTSLAWSPNGRRLATVAVDKTIRIWDVKSQEEVIQFRTDATSVDWHPDGKRLFTGHDDGSVRLWDATAGYLVKRATPSARNPGESQTEAYQQTYLGDSYMGIQRYPAAESAFRQAIEIQKRLLAEYPDAARNRHRLSEALLKRGNTLEKMARDADAEECFSHAAALAEQGRQQRPQNEEYLRIWADARNAIANLRVKQGKCKEAEQEYRRILQAAPLYRPALNDLAWLLATGADSSLHDPRQAIELAKKALSLSQEGIGENDHITYRKTQGVAYYRNGDWKKAIKALEGNGPSNRTWDDFFVAMAHWRLGDQDQAKQSFDRAIKWIDKQETLSAELQQFRAEAEKLLADPLTIDPKAAQAKDAESHYKSGNALFNQGQLDQAIAAYQLAIHLNPDYAEAHHNLGHAYKTQGQFQDALKSFERGRELGGVSSKYWAQMAQGWIKLDRQVSAVLKEEIHPANVNEWLEYVQICEWKKTHGNVVRLWQLAFLKHPSLPSNYRFRASQSAVLASGNQGDDTGAANDMDRIAFRKQAHEWLKADLDTWSKKLFQTRQLKTTIDLTRTLLLWQYHPNFVQVRDEKHLAKLAKEERESWQRLWTEVEQLRKQAESMFKETTRVSGTVTLKERETVHEVKLQAGTTYVIDLESKAFDTLLRVKDAKGKTLAENDDVMPGVNLNSRLIFTPQTDGVYRLVASAFEESGSGPYTLTIREFVK